MIARLRPEPSMSTRATGMSRITPEAKIAATITMARSGSGNEQGQVPAASPDVGDLAPEGGGHGPGEAHLCGHGNSTLMPGLRPATGRTGRAWTSKLRTS